MPIHSGSTQARSSRTTCTLPVVRALCDQLATTCLLAVHRLGVPLVRSGSLVAVLGALAPLGQHKDVPALAKELATVAKRIAI